MAGTAAEQPGSQVVEDVAPTRVGTARRIHSIARHLPFLAALALLCVWYRGVFAVWRGEWFGNEGYYSHGALVPVLAGLLVWQRRGHLAAAPWGASLWGIVVVLLGGLLKIVSTWQSAHGVEAFASLSFPVVLWGAVLALYGRAMARVLAVPAAFLFLMCPLPGNVLMELTFPLQFISTRIGVAIASLAGTSATQDGTTIHLTRLSLFVGVACSGFKSTLSMLTLAGFAAASSRLRAIPKLLLLASAIPIGLGSNALRIALVIAAAERSGRARAEALHDLSGYLMLALACVFVWGVAKVLAWMDDTELW